jgi:ribonuclease VapC
MIVIDTSALIAVLENEPDGNRFIDAMGDAEQCLISAVSLHEAGAVIQSRHRARGLADLNALCDLIDAQIIAFDETQARIAIDAFGRFGKSIHSKARLNIGDCASYALAKSRNLPLLFKGNDFKSTDIAAALS